MISSEEAAASFDAGSDTVHAADAEIVRRVREAGRDSPEAEQLMSDLRDYGLGTLINMAKRGQILSRVRNLRSRGWTSTPPMPPPPEYPDDERSLIFLSVDRASRRFLDRILDGRWDPTRGASLATYFVTACLHSFADEYRGYHRSSNPSFFETPVEDIASFEVAADMRQPSSNPERTAIERSQIAEILERLPVEDQRILQLVALGMPLAEVGTALGMTEAAVSSRLRRTRRKVRDDERGDTIFTDLAASTTHSITNSLLRRLNQWGVASREEAVKIRDAIELSRKVYENPQRQALYRPLPDDDRNQLDIILGGLKPGTAAPDNERWVANSARVCRDVLARVTQSVPTLHRPDGRRKGIADDLRDLYAIVKGLTDLPDPGSSR